MYCIKKGWKLLSLKMLDYPNLARVKKQNITNAHDMALKYGMNDVTDKIKTFL